MLDKKIAFVGCGNMGSAIVAGYCADVNNDPKNIIVSRRSEDKLKELEDKYHVDTTTNNKFAVEVADMILLCVKPNMIEEIANELRNAILPEATIVSIAAGVTLETLKKHFPNNKYIFRAMPNTPAQVQEGMTALCIGDIDNKQRIQAVIDLFLCCGQCDIISEKNLSAFIGVSGSSPAYVYMMIEAMADAGVKEGLTRDQALQFSSQAVLGAAKMVLETKCHPGYLKDQVCSPGGTTIEAVVKLEEHGFRNAVMQGVHAAAKKNREME